ncbi:DUF6817 domain-containing protein [Streptomyces sp. NPDC002588]|uniref:DUF6817 domain-containing protein n=1 Tax=Streptomyces sp. NPDC002588 TaxID=3154419 RepID=UPI003326CEEA
MTDDDVRIARAEALLTDLGAADSPHPGGTLLAHLRRVRSRLADWGAGSDLQLTGLCHAAYGTDGFPRPLLPLDRRGELAAVIGDAAEAGVYLYAACDRGATYPTLTGPGAPFRDRFTGATLAPGPLALAGFAELSAANEIDLAVDDPAFRDRWGTQLLALFTRFGPLLSRAAREDCRAVLGGADYR